MPTLRQARHVKGITQKTLAGLIGVNARQISAWERGLDEPKLLNTQKLCEVLGIGITDIEFKISVEGNNFTKPVKDAIILERIEKMINE